MKNPALVLPEVMPHIMGLNAIIEKSGVPAKTLGLVHLRTSQINGCSVCLDMHAGMAEKHGETIQRMLTVAGWREAPYFSDAERAALALTECVTRIADKGDPVPDDVWNEAAKHYDEKQLSGLILSISLINVFNRINATTRQIAGQQRWDK
jgi:AhpD family alkylhydroperoxidase